MSRRRWIHLLATLATTVVIVAFLRTDRSAIVPSASPVSPVSIPQPVDATSTNAFVLRAVDGDTLEVRRDEDADAIKVRLLGIDTPESVDPRRPVECFGKEASNYTASLTEEKRVLLVADPQADEVDKYGRLLRNVFLDDGTDVNAALVRDGYAHAYLSFPLDTRRKAELSKLQREAQAAGRGLWAPGVCD